MSEAASKEKEDAISVIRKMASRRLVGTARRMNPVLALKAALPKAAELELNMRLTVKEAKEGVLDTQAMMEAIPEDSLVTILAAKDGAQGLAGFDPQLLAALIEMQTTGHVSTVRAVVRPWTITDGQMCEPFIDRVFDVLEMLLDADGRGPWFYGYRFLRKVNDRRKLAMTLEETRYLFYACKVELGDGAKTGMLWLALPDSVRNATTDGQVGPENADWQGGLRSAVLGSTVPLNAILYKSHVPLSWVMSLQAGQIINVPAQQIDTLSIVDSGDRVVGTAKLGQASGQRAIRIMSKGSESAGGLVASGSAAKPSAPPIADLPSGMPPPLPSGVPSATSGDGALSELPEMPATGGLPDLPSFPNLPAGGGLLDLPPIGGVGDLSGLPDLPGFPPLPS